ncbi:MAG: hypothetical protein ACRERE_26500 [Candidatus Entotheonellia bacterium]
MLQGVGHKDGVSAPSSSCARSACNVISEDFERYGALVVERLRSEVTKAFQKLVEMLDTRIK